MITSQTCCTNQISQTPFTFVKFCCAKAIDQACPLLSHTRAGKSLLFTFKSQRPAREKEREESSLEKNTAMHASISRHGYLSAPSMALSVPLSCPTRKKKRSSHNPTRLAGTNQDIRNFQLSSNSCPRTGQL